jgi:hypothetical protein
MPERETFKWKGWRHAAETVTVSVGYAVLWAVVWNVVYIVFFKAGWIPK